VKPYSVILLALSGLTCEAYAAAAENPVSAVRALRAESNAATAAHDAHRLRKIFDDDYHGFQGTSGEFDSGGAATAQSK
jgi:hypothetical protein